MKITELVISYDREADVVYLSFGKPRDSVSEEVDDCALLRRDSKTNKITGVTIMNFGRYFDAESEMKVELLEGKPLGRSNSTAEGLEEDGRAQVDNFQAAEADEEQGSRWKRR